ncbi:MAG: iron uptake system protein EfeO [Halopseudomonas sp.]|uniref:iron uptake system protein EfeO n=1 Tax=Halopseudomonas sp. TaxID=2901191 RepID=UPI0030011F18
MSDNASPSVPSAGLLRLGIVLSALVMLVALGLFYLSLEQPATGEQGTRVTITATGCEPKALSVPAGKQRFVVINQSERAIEWEILDGVMVLEERENIAPQLQQAITATLAPGEYQMTCGLLSNPRGTLTVTPVQGADVAPAVSAKAFIGPLAEYRVYLTLQGRQLQAAVDDLQSAIAANDLPAAQESWREARLIDERIALAVGLFSDLDQRLNGRADYFAQREQDPDFAGFHRLAVGLFAQQSTAELLPVAQQLNADVRQLRARLNDDGVPAAQLTRGAARVLQAWHDYQQSQQRVSELELADLRGLQQGADKVVSLLAPLLQNQVQSVGALQQANLALADALQQASPDRAALLQRSQGLAQALAQVNEQLAPGY